MIQRKILGNNLVGKATPLPEKRSKVLCKLDEIDLENLTPKSLIQTQAVLIQYLKSLKRNRMPDNMKEALKAMKEREIVSDPILEEYNVIKVDSFQRKSSFAYQLNFCTPEISSYSKLSRSSLRDR